MPKVKIICTEKERREFEQHNCPYWKSDFKCGTTHKTCSECWAQYVDWETEE